MQYLDAKPQFKLEQPAADLPAYLPPTVVTYTDEQLLEALGPAQAQPYGAG